MYREIAIGDSETYEGMWSRVERKRTGWISDIFGEVKQTNLVVDLIS